VISCGTGGRRSWPASWRACWPWRCSGGVTFWRDGDSAASVRVAFTRDLLEALILVAGPLLLATVATWLAARRVAGQYARETAAGAPLEER